MHDQPNEAASNAAEDTQGEKMVLVHIIEAQPNTLRLSDLIRELTSDPEDFTERDGIERAVRDLKKAGLLFGAYGAILPTRQAIHAYELLAEAA